MRPEDEITCREFVELVTDYFEGTLPSPTLSLTEEHLVMCDWCATYAEQLRTTSELLAETEHSDAHGHPRRHEPAPALLAALNARREDQP